MGPALLRIDVVGVRIERLGVGVVVLQRDVYGDAAFFGGEMHRLVQHILVGVDHVDELDDSTFE